MTPLVFVLVCGVAVCNCQTAAGQTVECKYKRDQTERGHWFLTLREPCVSFCVQ